MLASVSQHTVRHPFTITGIGVHSGAPATLTVKPAAPFSGIIFVRTDIKDRANTIAARWNNVTETRLCTVLSNADGATVSTVEHLLSAFAALGLDNAIVIDGDRILNEGGLRFKNEFVRHKILDAIGDIYLMGLQMIGHYHGVKAGHAMNNKILHVLFSQPDAYEIVELGSEAPRRVTVPVGKFYGEDMPVAAMAGVPA